MKKRSFISLALLIVTAFFFTTVRAEFQVAFTSTVEQMPVVSYNSQTGKFLVAYTIEYDDGSGEKYYAVRCQLHNADGSKSGSAFSPFGDTGTIKGLGRPALAYNEKQNIFFVAIAERLSSYDRVIGRFLNGDGTNRVGPDFLFESDSAASPRYVDGVGTGSLRIVYNSLLDEFLVTVQRDILHSEYGTSVRHNTIAAQRISESHIYPLVELSDFGFNGLPSHAVAYAPITDGTSPGGRYLFAAGAGLQLLNSDLTRMTYVPVVWGNPNGGARDPDIAYGEIDGKNMFLVIVTDTNNCEPGFAPPCTGREWTGVWGTYVDPLITSYPTPPTDATFPISVIYKHMMTGVFPIQGARVSYGEDAQGFFIVWRELPSNDPLNGETRSHIRGAFVDYYLTQPGSGRVPNNLVISTVTGSTCSTGDWCPSAEDPDFPDVAAMNGYSAVVVWDQKYPPLPTDFDVMGDLFALHLLTVSTTGTGSGTVHGGGHYAEGMPVTLAAIPDTGSSFKGWSSAPCGDQFVMPDNDLNCIATFTATPPQPTGKLGGRVWQDSNGNSVEDNGEFGIPGVTLDLDQSDGTHLLAASTDANGNYFFTNLLLGNYVIRVSGGIPAGYTQTGDPDGILDAQSQYSLAADETHLSIDFGYRLLGDLDGNSHLDCDDLKGLKAAFGKKAGQAGFNPSADMNKDSVINIKDFAALAQKLPAGKICP